jgi:gamma-glutamyl-gamma-aminobutyrate hydrolase PuuD
VHPLIGISAETDMVARYWGTDAHQLVDDDYVRAVLAAGGLPVLIPVVDVDLVPGLASRLDGLVITGGNDIDPACYGETWLELGQGGTLDPARDRFDIALVRYAVSSGMPLLAICRGHQVVNVACGGSLIQHLPDHPDSTDPGAQQQPIRVDPASRLAQRFPSLAASNSYHHQAVDRLGEGVSAVAWAPDGVIEAIEIEGAPHVVSVQWHPEMLVEHAEHLALFEWLTRSATSHVHRPAGIAAG